MVVVKVLFFFFFVGVCYCEEPSNVGIIGGHQITIDRVPYMASLRVLRMSGLTHHCGASIINKRFILTAAHCINGVDDYKVSVGSDRMNSKDGELYDIEAMYIPKWFSNLTYNFDVCLIKLASDLVFDKKVAPIKLADHTVNLYQNTMLNVTGWGSTGNRPFSSHLLQATVPFVSRVQCQYQYRPYKFNITLRMMCAGTNGKDSCQGDSGGPLTVGDIQVGITSFGKSCGKIPGVYTKVSTVLRWIRRTMRKNW